MSPPKFPQNEAASASESIDYQQLLDLSTDAIFVRDVDGRIRYWNQGAERVYGFTRSEALGKISHDLLQTVFLTPFQEIVVRVEAQGRWDGELQQRRKDGGRIIVESHWALNRDANGMPRFFEHNKDITKRRAAEQALVASEARFRGLLESAPDAIVIVDGQGRISLLNRQLALIFGYTPDELLGRPIEVLLPERFRERHLQHREQFAEQPSTRPMGTALDLYALRKNGEEFPVEVSLSPLGEGSDLLVTAVIRDVSVRKRHEADERRLHTLQLAEAEHLATLGEIAAGLAHEIRNPLGGISGALQILAPGMASADDREIAQEMQQLVTRIQRVVNELLHYARPRPVQLAPHDLNHTLENAAQFVRRQVTGRAVEVVFEPGALPPVVHDPEQIHRLVTNLGLNSVQAVADGGRVVIASWLDEGRGLAGIEVRDNGPGIAPGDLEKIFRPFYSTKGGRGTGLGLSLCRRIAELHGGAITVRSTPGSGCTFTVTLPLGEGTKTAATPGSEHGR